MRQKEACPLYHKALLSVAEAAAYTGIGTEKLYEYAEKKGMQIFQVLSEDGKKQHRRERKKCMTV